MLARNLQMCGVGERPNSAYGRAGGSPLQASFMNGYRACEEPGDGGISAKISQPKARPYVRPFRSIQYYTRRYGGLLFSVRNFGDAPFILPKTRAKRAHKHGKTPLYLYCVHTVPGFSRFFTDFQSHLPRFCRIIASHLSARRATDQGQERAPFRPLCPLSVERRKRENREIMGICEPRPKWRTSPAGRLPWMIDGRLSEWPANCRK